MLFPRSASRPWYRLTFDTSALEREFEKAVFHRQSRLFKVSIGFIILLATAWLIYSSIKGSFHVDASAWTNFATIYFLPFLAAIIESISILLAAHYLNKYNKPRSISQSICSCSIWFVILLSVTMALYPAVGAAVSGLTPLGIFSIYASITMMAYTSLSLSLAAALCFSIGFTLLLEIAFCSRWAFDCPRHVASRFLAYLALHAIAILYHVIYQSRLRETFWFTKETQSARQIMEAEQTLKQNILFSIMPSKFAKKFLLPEATEIVRRKSLAPTVVAQKQQQELHLHVFRPLHVERFDNVSILFADICGFTKMASNKRASDLVMLLDELFSNFDRVCAVTGCEKISTLGDCYYCVSGCPLRRPDHAHCCVETGLGVCKAIQTFAATHSEQVNMRVGIHTGTVLCGVVGVKRLKFDVWSNDVVLANLMESSGEPGRVHISQDTHNIIKNDYETEEGPDVEDIRGIRELEEFYDPVEGRVITRGQCLQRTLNTHFVLSRKSPCVYQKLTDDNEVPFGPTAPEIISEIVRTSRAANDDASIPLMSAEQQTMIVTKRNRTVTITTFSEMSTTNVVRPSESSPTNDDDDEINIFLKPPVTFSTLRFLDDEVETAYRSGLTSTLTSYTTKKSFKQAKQRYIGTWAMSLFICAAVAGVCVAIAPTSYVSIAISTFLFLVTFTSTFFLWKCTKASLLFGSSCLLASLSGVIVLVSFNCKIVENRDSATIYLILTIVSILHFTFYSNVPYFIRAAFGTALSLTVVILLPVSHCELKDAPIADEIGSAPATTTLGTLSPSLLAKYYPNAIFSKIGYSPGYLWLTTPSAALYSSASNLFFEALIALVSSSILVWFLSWEYELVARLAWYASNRLRMTNMAMREAKAATDSLVENVIPLRTLQKIDYRSGHLATKLSNHHFNCGVMFACIKNFSDWYEEGYNSGEGCLRVLNEIFGDFESLLDRPQFKTIEKIKTIGPCLMCASGLDDDQRADNKAAGGDENEHLYAMIEYGLALIEALDRFNEQSMMGAFNFKLYIGINTGDLISGVVGSAKLHYDIWGDTVNVASRMYSTGLAGRIQVSEDVALKLGSRFKFEKRGTIPVKGKDDMTTYLVGNKLSLPSSNNSS